MDVVVAKKVQTLKKTGINIGVLVKSNFLQYQGCFFFQSRKTF